MQIKFKLIQSVYIQTHFSILLTLASLSICSLQK